MDPKNLVVYVELNCEIEELEAKIAPGTANGLLPAIDDPYGGRGYTSSGDPTDSTDTTDGTDTTETTEGGKVVGGGGGRGGRK
jgi:hypothetical protein